MGPLAMWEAHVKYLSRSMVASPSRVGWKISIPVTEEAHHFFSRQGLCLNAFRSRTANWY